jgi:hypothetical protein
MAVTPDAVGAGGLTASGAATINVTWTHAVFEGASLYLAFAVGQGGTTGVYTAHTRTVTCDGQAMTFKTAYHLNNSNTLGWVELWEIKNLPAGAKTLSVTVAKTGATYTNLKGNSVSYTGTSSSAVIAPTGGTTNATTMPHTLTGEATSYLLRSCITEDSVLSGLSNNSRYLDAGEAPSLGMHDVTGSASTAFAATRTQGVDWASVGLEIQPTPQSFTSSATDALGILDPATIVFEAHTDATDSIGASDEMVKDIGKLLVN